MLERLIDILGRLGFNTTRLKWKLFQLEKRKQQPRMGVHLPVSLQWLSYPNKHCGHCHALVDGSARTCPNCGKRVSSLLAYRVNRLLGVAAPQGSPVVVGGFIFVMLVHYFVMASMQGFSALFNPTYYSISVFGAWSPALAILRHGYWRYLSFGLAHGSLMHIAFNIFALMQVGPVIEERIGPWRMMVVITVTQLAAAFASHFYYYSYLQAILTPTVGASGWLMGLIGFGIAYFHSQVGAAKDYQRQLIQWGAYSIAFGFVIGANNAAHVGGMLAGLALGLIPDARRQTAPIVNAAWQTAAGICAALWIVTLGYLGHSVLTHWAPGGHPSSAAVELVDENG